VTRMTIGQFWPQRRRYSSNPEAARYHQEKWADMVMTPFTPTCADLRRLAPTGGASGAKTSGSSSDRWTERSSVASFTSTDSLHDLIS
jgi:hypothetical protein